MEGSVPLNCEGWLLRYVLRAPYLTHTETCSRLVLLKVIDEADGGLAGEGQWFVVGEEVGALVEETAVLCAESEMAGKAKVGTCAEYASGKILCRRVEVVLLLSRLEG
jgi:hypothetical protein